MTRTVKTGTGHRVIDTAGHVPEGTVLAVITVIFSDGQHVKPWPLVTGWR